MEQALISFLNFVRINLVEPIRSALSSSTIFQSISDFFLNFLRAFFKLWNNDNNFLSEQNYLYVYSLISEVLGLLFVILIFNITISMFNLIFNTVKKAF